MRRLLAFSLLLPADASAHLVSTGIGPFYDGLVHLFISAQDLLFCLGIGLLAGSAGKQTARAILLASAGAWIAGGTIGLAGLDAGWSIWAAPSMLLVIGVLVALDMRMPSAVVVSGAALFSALHGFINGDLVSTVGLTALLGTYAGVVGVGLLTASAVVGITTLWARTAVRVGGSWIGAAGLLLLGWSLRSVIV